MFPAGQKLTGTPHWASYIDRSQVLAFLELSKDVAVEQLSCVCS